MRVPISPVIAINPLCSNKLSFVLVLWLIHTPRGDITNTYLQTCIHRLDHEVEVSLENRH